MEMSFDNLEYQVRMKPVRPDDALQKWILNTGDGSLRPEAHPDMRLAVADAEDGEEEKGKKAAKIVDTKSEGQCNVIILMREKKVWVWSL